MTNSTTQHVHSLFLRAGALLLGLALAASLSACGDDGNGGSGMNAPTVAQQIDNQTISVDDQAVEVADLNNTFDGENLSFQASSSDGGVVSASVDGGTLTITPQDGGTATVTASAENDAGTTDTSFEVTVELTGAPGPPSGS